MQIPDARLRIPRAAIAEHVGDVMDERGRDYVRRGKVVSWAWRPARSSAGHSTISGSLIGRVRGSGRDAQDRGASLYAVRVELTNLEPETDGPDATWQPVASACACPVRTECKHVAAILHAATMLKDELDDDDAYEEWLVSGHTRDAARAPTTSWHADDPTSRLASAWRALLSSMARTSDTRGATPLAIGVELLLRHGHFGVSRFQPRAAGPSDFDDPTRLSVALRPLVPGAREPWIRGGLTWRSFRSTAADSRFPVAQREALSRIVGLVLAENIHRYDPGELLHLDDLASVESWALLRSAIEHGVTLVGIGPLEAVGWGEPAEVRLLVRPDAGGDSVSESNTSDAGHEAGDRADAGPPDGGARDLLVTAVPERGGEPLPTHIPGGRGGFALVHSTDDGWRLELVPVSATIPRPVLELLGRGVPLRVPAAEADEFLTDAAPQLRRSIAVASGDPSVVIPDELPPRLVLDVTHGTTPRDVPFVTVTQAWSYRAPSRTLPVRRHVAAASPEADRLAHPDRDLEAEEATLAGVRAAWPDAAAEPRRTLEGTEAAEFVNRSLPRLATLDGVDVREHGARPSFVELEGEPRLRITQVDPARASDRDWLELGFEITLGGQLVPFTTIFRALSAGKKAVLLLDKSYAKLDHPVFDRLRELIAEAEAMGEWEPERPRIGRYQVSLWEDFEDLADESIEAVAWRESIGALRALDRIPSIPPPKGLAATLREYQRDGLNWLAFLHANHLGGVLADDMGLGKTLQTLALAVHARETEPVAPPFLVVAPSSVLGVWRREAERFAPGLDVRVLDQTTAKRGSSVADAVRGADLVVTSYALLRLGEDEFADHEWAALILDEAQFVKNHAAKTHRAAARIRAPFRLAITGTPLENSLTDLWSLCSLTAPGLFASPRRFRQEYVRVIEQGGSDAGEHATATARLARLRRRVRPFLLRRTKELVAAELPAKQEQRLDVALSPAHRRLYDRVLQRERQKLLNLVDDLDRNRFIVFRSLTLLRMLALDPTIVDAEHANVPSSKLDALMERLPEAIADGHRVLVFSQFTSFLARVAERLETAGIRHSYLDGSTRDRDATIAEFRSGAAPVFLISLKAGGFGLTLTEADYVFVMDPWWNPAAEAQAVDRAHRIGQTRPVMVYRLVAEHTIEHKVLELQQRKAALFDAFTDGESAFSAALTADDVRELLGAE